MPTTSKNTPKEILVHLAMIDGKVTSIQEGMQEIKTAFNDHEKRIRDIERTQFTWKGAVAFGAVIFSAVATIVFAAFKAIASKGGYSL